MTRLEPVEKAVSALSGKWTLAVLGVLSGGPMRYSDLRDISGVDGTQLSRALHRLGSSGLIVRMPENASQPGAQYRLSADVAELGDILRALGEWWEVHERHSRGRTQNPTSGSLLTTGQVRGTPGGSGATR
jgi:DNA-binding HxlR family transcriptional regulator